MTEHHRRVPGGRLLLAAGMAGSAAAFVAPPTQAAAPTTATRHLMPTLAQAQILRSATGSHPDCVLPIILSVQCAGAGTPMFWGGGPIQTSPAVYIVYWGWGTGSDPNGEAAYQQKFFNGVGGTTWNASQTQYCSSTTLLGIESTCTSTAQYVGNPTGVLKSTWTDTTNAIPASPTDADIQAEAVRAAQHFGNTTLASNASAQYIIDTPHGNSTSGFGTQWCAYHDAASSSWGLLSYTDFPYQTDAGASCGEGFVNSGPAGLLDGVSIVGGHEFAEAETDPRPGYGWADAIGAETGDKCAWIRMGPGASTDVTLGTGTFAVQSLWSNNANSGAGGCVTYYAGAGSQH